MTQNLSQVIANANDFDGVFYNPHDIPDYYNHFAVVFAETLVKMLPTEFNYDTAIKLAYDGYNQHGDSVTGLMEWAYLHNLNGAEIRERFFRSYHTNLRSHFMAVAPHVFDATSCAARPLAKLQGIVRNGIATHGCAREFTRPLLPSMGIASYIEQNAVFGLADSSYLKKSTHTDLVLMCLDALKAAPEVAAYTEDTALNLRTHKEEHPKLTTVFINNGRPLDSKPNYIDYEFKSLEEYLNALHTAHKDRPKYILT